MATVNGSKPAVNAAKKWGGPAKWVVLGVLTLAVVIAAQAGLIGFGWAHLMAKTFPRDLSLLEYVPGDTGSLVIIDPHQLDAKALGGESSVARTYLSRTREEVKKATGIDLFFDVDKLTLTPALVVARGRFNQKKLTTQLSEARYLTAEHKGQSYLVRAGEDAIAVIDDGILLYGEEASIKAAIDAKQGGSSLAKSDVVPDRLKSVGWDHPVLVTVRITDERPSIRAILKGSTGPRSLTVGAKTVNGLDLTAVIESVSPASAAELQKLLEEKRGSVDDLKSMVGSDAALILVEVAKKATITNNPAQSFVKIQLHIDPSQLDALIKAAGSAAPFGELYKDMRLFQLLVPNL
jgi:hypothetical protein